jgi:hypothetical protein
MIKNKHIQVVNENGTSVLLSGAIIVEYLKDYTSDWGSISTKYTIDQIEGKYTPSDSDDPVNKTNMDTFSKKIAFILPKISLKSLIDETIAILKNEDIEYLIMFQSFNNLEKVAMYFILMIQSKRSVKEIFDMMSANYKDISKRDIMIKLLSEIDVIESNIDAVDPINGLYRLMSSVPTHAIQNTPSFTFEKEAIEFKEFTFPMHSYNVTKRLTGLNPNAGNGSVRNYYSRFNDTWKRSLEWKINYSINKESFLYKKDWWKDILKESIFNNEIYPYNHNSFYNYEVLLDKISYKTDIEFSQLEEKPLFKYLNENFFDFTLPSLMDNETSQSPLTMTEHMSEGITNFNKDNLEVGSITYDDDFKNLKTVLSYYMSDLNFWFTRDIRSKNEEYSDYQHTQEADGFLTSKSKSETKGYFSNIMFIQNAIQRILYPKILKFVQSTQNTYDVDDIFNVDKKVYEDIFDCIVNNSFVFTEKTFGSTGSTVLDDNYEIIPNRAILETDDTDDPASDLINYKATNLYEFIINTLVHNNDNVISGSTRKIIDKDTIDLYTRQELLYKQDVANYNPLGDKITTDDTSLTVSDFGGSSVVYDFDDNYTPRTNWMDKIVETFFKINDGNTYSKINYRDINFFKLPVHSEDLANQLNRCIVRTDRELLTDISDLAGFNIKGLSLADFTYGEKALLKEYIENFKIIKKINKTDADVVLDMIKELDDIQEPYYFPEDLTYGGEFRIKTFLNRAILKIDSNRESPTGDFVSQAKNFVKYSAINPIWSDQKSTAGEKIKMDTIGKKFLETLKFIVSYIKDSETYTNKFESFTTAYKEGSWSNVSPIITHMKDIMLDDTLIEEAISEYDLYTGDSSDILKDLDIGLYKLAINNYFDYLLDTSITPQPNLQSIVFVDNNSTGFIKYYTDILVLLKFIDKYYEFVPKYVKYLNDKILGTYYNRIDAIKSLPSWDYESFHRRDLESDLKTIVSGGLNSNDYNIVWSWTVSEAYRNVSLIYKNKESEEPPNSYKISSALYRGGLSNTYSAIFNEWRDVWWRRWLFVKENSTNAFSWEKINAFKIPDVTISDNNIEFPSTWEYGDPDWMVKIDKFRTLNKLSRSNANEYPYQPGLVANISSFYYERENQEKEPNSPYLVSIGVPILLLGDDGSEWNKPNTTREKSFSFETDFFNLWHTDEGYNGGEGAAYSGPLQLVSRADKFKKFGLGKMDIQQMFRYFWNMESSPMGQPYNVMAYYVFDGWNQGYDYEAGHFPYATVKKDNGHFKSNKYDFKFVLQESYREGIWSPVRLSGEDRSLGVDPEITADQIRNNFYLTTPTPFESNTDLKNAIFDIYNRNFRNRVYLSYLRWRYLYNQGEGAQENETS